MCLIRQATNRVRASKEAGKTNQPCEVCAGVVNHYFPCTSVINLDKESVKVL